MYYIGIGVPVDVPISEVSVGGVLDVSDLGGHDLPGDVLLWLDAALQHGLLQLAQDLHTNRTCRSGNARTGIKNQARQWAHAPVYCHYRRLLRLSGRR